MLCKAHNCPFPGCHDGKASSAEHCDVHASSSLEPSNGLYGFAVSAPPDNMYDEAAPNDAAAEFSDERFGGFGPGDPEPAPTYGMNMSAGSAPAPAAYGMNPGQPGDQLAYTVLAPAAGAYGMNPGQPGAEPAGLMQGNPEYGSGEYVV